MKTYSMISSYQNDSWSFSVHVDVFSVGTNQDTLDQCRVTHQNPIRSQHVLFDKHLLTCFIKVKETLGCEIEKFKQQLLMHHVLSQPQTCLFNDVTTVGDEDMRKCIKHDDRCVPRHNRLLSVFDLCDAFSLLKN